ncbi:MAG: hypothetical protein LBL74_04165 [Bacteroidales bacterium]|nr:hypothetical protein [Bacteroidales bacterium]
MFKCWLRVCKGTIFPQKAILCVSHRHYYSIEGCFILLKRRFILTKQPFV